MKKYTIQANLLLVLVFVLAGCDISGTNRQESGNIISEKNADIKSKTDDTEIIVEQENNLQDTFSTESEVDMKNIVLGTVPDGYYSKATQQGTLETFTYDTKDYIGNGNAIQSQATVYLPYGYDQNDDTRYNKKWILYIKEF